MSASILPWWGWLLVAGLLWLVQMFAFNHKIVRTILMAGMTASVLIAIIRFIKWVWV